MLTVKRSALFKRHLTDFVQGYMELAGAEVANRFIDALEKSICFIANHPDACTPYEVNGLHFRKWNISGFPHAIYFRVQNKTVIMEAVYAHRMDRACRLPSDFNQD
jgi:plasmid stabilization system protein ParE